MRFRVFINDKWYLPTDEGVHDHWHINRDGSIDYSIVSSDVKDAEVMFGTGVLDMNKIEMFEGDIFNVYERIGEEKLEMILPRNVLVSLADFLGGHYWLQHHGQIPVYEIIGNRIDNPELILTDRGNGCRDEECRSSKLDITTSRFPIIIG